jgi:hypothetical protein
LNGERLVGRQRADDSEAHPLVDETIQRRGVASVARPAHPRSASLSSSRFVPAPWVRGRCRVLATVPPRDLDPEHDVNQPEPATISQSPSAGGVNSAAAPEEHEAQAHDGMMRTENAPPATTAVPYRSSQTRQQIVRTDAQQRRRQQRSNHHRR